MNPIGLKVIGMSYMCYKLIRRQQFPRKLPAIIAPFPVLKVDPKSDSNGGARRNLPRCSTYNSKDLLGGH